MALSGAHSQVTLHRRRAMATPIATAATRPNHLVELDTQSDMRGSRATSTPTTYMKRRCQPDAQARMITRMDARAADDGSVIVGTGKLRRSHWTEKAASQKPLTCSRSKRRVSRR